MCSVAHLDGTVTSSTRQPSLAGPKRAVFIACTLPLEIKDRLGSVCTPHFADRLGLYAVVVAEQTAGLCANNKEVGVLGTERQGGDGCVVLVKLAVDRLAVSQVLGY